MRKVWALLARAEGLDGPGAAPCVVRRVHGAAALVTLAALGAGGCAQQPQPVAAHSKEYFPSSVYGPASRRVITDGPVPHGGGQYLVGKPYTVAGQTYYPTEKRLVQVGNASWYGDAFHGRLTANGEIYDRDSFTAAHPTMPLPSYARVTNLRNKASMIVRVNDRGPFASNRVMDVSRRVAEALDFKRTGTARIKVEYVGRASLAGSDDAKLYATLRTNEPAQWREEQPVMTAEAQPQRVAAIEPAPIAPERVAPEHIAPERIAPAPMAPERIQREPLPLRQSARPQPAPPFHPAPPLRTMAHGRQPAWHPEARDSVVITRSEPVPMERPFRPEPPVKPVQTASHQPALHWQQGPQGHPAASLAWTPPKSFAMPVKTAHSAGLSGGVRAHPVKLARSRDDD